MSSFKFANSFAGYTFSFSLLSNPFQNSDATKDAKLNAVLNVTLPTDSSICYPFINQFVLQPFGNTEASFNTNNTISKTTTIFPDSSFNAKGLSSFFAAAFTPGSFSFSYDANASGNLKVTLEYSYNCTNTVTGSLCANILPPVVFTFPKFGNNAKSDSQDIYVPYWTDAQLGDTTTSSGCYPTVDKIRVHLEADPAQQNVLLTLVQYQNFTNNRTKQLQEITNKLVSINPSLVIGTDSFPVLYFRVVQDDDSAGKLPSNNLRRPFVVSNIQSNGQEVNVLTAVTYGSDTIISYQDTPISTAVTQSTSTIGLLVFTNLYVYYTGSNNIRTIETRHNLGLELGSFPTDAGALISSNEINTIKNGDVVIIKAKYDWTYDFTINDGNYMGFEQENQDASKVPSMNSTPQNRNFTGSPSTTSHYYWQVVSLNANGNVTGNSGDDIQQGTPVGFRAYQCNSDDSFVTCGWLSAKSCNKNTGCYPTMNSTSNNCEVWTIQSFPSQGPGKTVQNGTDVTIQVSNQNVCGFPNQWLTNANRTGYKPPTLYSELATDRSIWTLTRIYSSMPLPTD